MAKRRKIGEKPQVRQPVKIDKLPTDFHQRIQEKRSSGWTWAEIESDSQTWKDLWKKVDAKTSALFPGEKLPHSNLSRWYDLRVEQVKQEVMAKAQRAREFAEAFASRGFKDLPEAVRSAFGDAVFSLMEDKSAASDQALRRDLAKLGLLLARERKLDIDERKVAAAEKILQLKIREEEERRKKFDKATNDAAAKIGKGKGLTAADIDKIRERTFGLPPVQRNTAAGPAA